MIIGLAIFAALVCLAVVGVALILPRKPKPNPNAPKLPSADAMSREIVTRRMAERERATSASVGGFTPPTRPAEPYPQRFMAPPPNLVVAPVVDPLSFAMMQAAQPTPWHEPAPSREGASGGAADFSGQAGSFSGGGASASFDSPSYSPPIHDTPSYSPPSFDSSSSCDSSSSSCGSFD